jgi:L-2-hydroxyglutarate oxidase LhgO
VPVPGGLGVHVTLDLAGRMRFGPGRRMDRGRELRRRPARARAFYARIRDYWPRLPDDSLAADYCRHPAEADGPGEPAADFMIDGPRAARAATAHSPVRDRVAGLTSALSLAEEVTSYLSS